MKIPALLVTAAALTLLAGPAQAAHHRPPAPAATNPLAVTIATHEPYRCHITVDKVTVTNRSTAPVTVTLERAYQAESAGVGGVSAAVPYTLAPGASNVWAPNVTLSEGAFLPEVAVNTWVQPLQGAGGYC